MNVHLVVEKEVPSIQKFEKNDRVLHENKRATILYGNEDNTYAVTYDTPGFPPKYRVPWSELEPQRPAQLFKVMLPNPVRRVGRRRFDRFA